MKATPMPKQKLRRTNFNKMGYAFADGGMPPAGADPVAVMRNAVKSAPKKARPKVMSLVRGLLQKAAMDKQAGGAPMAQAAPAVAPTVPMMATGGTVKGVGIARKGFGSGGASMKKGKYADGGDVSSDPDAQTDDASVSKMREYEDDAAVSKMREYEKDTPVAQTFKEAFRAAKGNNFTWKGKRFSGDRKVDPLTDKQLAALRADNSEPEGDAKVKREPAKVKREVTKPSSYMPMVEGWGPLGKTRKYAAGGSVSSDGKAQRGRTRGSVR